MRQILLSILFISGLYTVTNCQSAGLSLSWNGTAYAVKMVVTTGANPLFLGSSQISIVTPAAMATGGISVVCASPCTPNTWVANTFVNAPAAAPGSNFVAIANLGGNMGNITAGTEVTLFTFTLPGGCDTGVRLFDNTNDPNSSQMPAGQDFKNSLVNGLNAFEFYNGSNNNNIVCAPLPLELLRFNAQWENNTVRLGWLTANERDMDHFDVQRATDGVRFESIGEKEAGNQVENIYAFTDERLPAARVLYYRLQMYNQNGRSDLSPVRRVSVTAEKLRLAVSPNPASDILNISVFSPDETTVSLQITNAAGTVMYSERHTITDNMLQWSKDISQWASGTYIVTATTASSNAEQRIVVQH